MKLSVLVLLFFVGTSIAQTRGKCPTPKVSFGACVFDPKVNCVGDEECKSGEICCASGCNKECVVPLKDDLKDDSDNQCPPSRPSFGACVFDPKVNCVSDAECPSNQFCCPSGCNKVCKTKTAPRPKPPHTPRPPAPGSSRGEGTSNQNAQCPPSRPTFGACVFNPEVNCLSDNECQSGQFCCSEGCNKICKSPLGSDDPSKLPIGKPSCPATPVTFGACVFNPDRNCLDDSACPTGKLCCSDGCNKVCMTPGNLPPVTQEDSYTKCPARTPGAPFIGTCVFDANKNCLTDSECIGGKVCCPSGCNKMCMNPQPRAVHPATKP